MSGRSCRFILSLFLLPLLGPIAQADIFDWRVTSVSPRWLGTTEFVLEDPSQGTVTIL